MDASSPPVMRPARTEVAAAMLAVFVGTLALYAYGTAPGLLYRDGGEFQSVALLGGIPHSSGYPTFVMIGRLFALLPFEDPAFRINFMSAFFGAAAVALMVLVLIRLGASRAAAVAGAILFGSSFTLWTGSLRAEIYTLAIALAVLALERSIVAFRSGRFRDQLVAGLALGLTLTGHLTFAPMTTVLGLALAWHVCAAGGGETIAGRLAALLGAFVVGLTPFLYLFWADGQSFEMNYFDQVRRVVAPLGEPIPGFETTTERLVWLLTGRNAFPAEPFVFLWRPTAYALVSSAFCLFLFEFGPLGPPLAIVGLHRQLREDRWMGLILLVIAGVSTMFAAAVTLGGSILSFFLIPTTMVMSAWIGLGLDRGLRLAQSRSQRALRLALAIGVPIAALFAAEALRAHVDRHPIAGKFFGPRTLVYQEDGLSFAAPIPSLRGYDEPRRFADRVVAAMPESALVVAEWGDMVVMYYVQRVQHRRRDLELVPWGPNVLTAVAAWQNSRDLERRPVAFLSKRPTWWDQAGAVDSLAAVESRFFYVLRSPLAVRLTGPNQTSREGAATRTSP